MATMGKQNISNSAAVELLTYVLNTELGGCATTVAVEKMILSRWKILSTLAHAIHDGAELKEPTFQRP